MSQTPNPPCGDVELSERHAMSDYHDGAPCKHCGDDAVTVLTVAEGSRLIDVPLCGPCCDDAVTICPSCEYRVWQNDCTRIGSELYCEGCAAKHPVVVGDVMAGILADEQQDQFNRSRR